MAKGKGGDNEGANPEEFNVPEALSEAELKSLNALLHKLPIPHLDDLKEHQKECCCCCCCGKDNATGPGTAANFDFNPSLTIYAIPFSGSRRAISRIEGTFSWNAPAGTRASPWNGNATILSVSGFKASSRSARITPVFPHLDSRPGIPVTRFRSVIASTSERSPIKASPAAFAGGTATAVRAGCRCSGNSLRDLRVINCGRM